jgi:glycolate oxidase
MLPMVRNRRKGLEPYRLIFQSERCLAFIDELKSISGKHVFTSKEDLVPFLRDASYFVGEFPLAVVMPETSAEVANIMTLCNENKVQVTVRGGGTSLTGASIPTAGGIVISLARMNRILETRISDGYVVAEPAVTIENLNLHLAKYHFFYPPDPGSSIVATVGGTISTNAGGLRAAMYGTTKEWVLGLELVLPTGETIETGGRTLKRSKGYDFTALMAGSEGTLAIITKAILKIWPIPEVSGRVVAYFKAIADAGGAIAELKSRGVTPYIAEFMDRLCLESIKVTRGLAYPGEAEYMLIVDIATTRESIDRQLESAKDIIKTFNPVALQVTQDPLEMQKMYEARKGLYSSMLSQRDNPSEYAIIGDIVVPPSSLPETLAQVKDAVANSGLKILLYGHIGDGNIHANIFVDLSNREQHARADKFQEDFGRIALAHGGSVSSEHGVGIEKKQLLLMEFAERKSESTLELMRKVKAAFDPNNILNRGKVFD